jgi:hypothetical protein
MTMNDPKHVDTPASQAIFDTHNAVRTKIETANRAVFEALTAMVAYGDPMMPLAFNARK